MAGDVANVNHQTAYEWVRDAGIMRSKSEADRVRNSRRFETPYEERELEAVILLLKGGKTHKGIADKLDVARSSITRWAKKHGIKPSHALMSALAVRKDRGRFERVNQAWKLHTSGRCVEDIASIMGRSVYIVRSYLRTAKEAFGIDQSEKHRIVSRVSKKQLEGWIGELTIVIQSGIDSRFKLTGLRNHIEKMIDRVEAAEEKWKA